MGSLAALLLPLIPSLVQSVLEIVKTIQAHPDTPEGVKAQLAEIGADLDRCRAKVAAVELPS